MGEDSLAAWDEFDRFFRMRLAVLGDELGEGVEGFILSAGFALVGGIVIDIFEKTGETWQFLFFHLTITVW